MNDTRVLDLAVIGSGGAAMAAAIAARQAGKSVVLVEQGTLGGTCVNVGCVPSKTLLAAAGARHGALANPFPGAPTSAGPVDLAALVEQKDELVGRLRQGKYAAVADAHGFEVRPGRARFTDPDTLTVDGTPLPAHAYLIATGAEPARPDLPGLDGIDWLSSTTAMELAQLPESLVVIGGGYVGMEQAQLFAHLGSRVTLVGRLAPAAEPELAEVLRAVFADDGITVIEDRAATVRDDAGLVVVSTRSGRRASGARLLVATGRTPRTPELGLDAAGVKTDDRGFVLVDEAQRSSNPRIFAAGDVAGSPQYVYVAAATGRAAALNATGSAGPGPATVDYTGLPAVVFTRPQLASAGLTEAAAARDSHADRATVLAGDLDARTAELVALTEQHTQLGVDRDGLAGQLVEARGLVEQLQAELAEARTSNAQLGADRDRVVTDLAAARAETAEQRRRAETAERDLVRADDAATSARAQLAETRTQLETAAARADAVTAELATARDGLREQRGRAELAEHDLARAETAAQAAAAAAREQLDATRSALETDLAAARARAEQQSTDAAAARQDLAVTRTQLEGARGAIAAEKAHSDQRVADRRDAYEAQLDALRARIPETSTSGGPGAVESPTEPEGPTSAAARRTRRGGSAGQSPR